MYFHFSTLVSDVRKRNQNQYRALRSHKVYYILHSHNLDCMDFQSQNYHNDDDAKVRMHLDQEPQLLQHHVINDGDDDDASFCSVTCLIIDNEREKHLMKRKRVFTRIYILRIYEKQGDAKSLMHIRPKE